MSAEAIAQLILALAQLTPQVIEIANNAKAAMSATDQATINAALATLQQSAMADLATAEADLDAAAKS